MKPVLINLIDCVNSIVTFCAVFESDDSKIFNQNMTLIWAKKVQKKLKIYWNKWSRMDTFMKDFVLIKKKEYKKLCIISTGSYLSNTSPPNFSSTGFEFKRFLPKEVQFFVGVPI